MIFDTDIFIWVQRGNAKAAALIDGTNNRFLSVQTYMELLQCAKDKQLFGPAADGEYWSSGSGLR